MQGTVKIPGYTYGAVGRSPITTADFDLMKKAVLFGDEDEKYLRLSHGIVEDQVEAILDVWYGFIGSNPHLVAPFLSTVDGKPIGAYLDGVRKRFGQWILDTARAEYDQRWLDYQHEIGLRHHRAKKNRTDQARGSDIVPFRYLFPVIFPVTATLKPFLAKQGHSADEVDKMQAAWVKSCLLQLTLWSYPYIKEGDF